MSGVTGMRRFFVPYLLRRPARAKGTLGMCANGSGYPKVKCMERMAASLSVIVPGVFVSLDEQWTT
jgi:hypothetical protein